MDASRFKRRTTQTPRQLTQIRPGGLNGIVPPQLSSARPPLRPVVPVQQLIPAEAPPAPQQSPLDMILSDEPVSKRGQGRGRWYAVRTWALRGVIAGLVLIIAVGGVLFSQGAFKLHKVFHGGTTTAASLKANVNPDLLKGEGDGRVNILLLGRGGGTHEAPDLTDTMILVSIDPVNHTQSLLSIPRDLWVKVPNVGSMKINAAWETGEFRYLGKVKPGSTDPKAIQAGFDMADATVESVLGEPINYNVIVDFDAFQQAVTTVGGVTINAPTDLIDGTMAHQNNKSPILAKAGLNTFNGGQALNYVRSRETTSDFARAQRQRAVMLAIKDKIVSAGTLSNPVKLSQLISDFGNNVSTDLSISNANRLYQIVSVISDTTTSSIGLADKPNNYVTTGVINGQSIDQPTAGLNNYSAIQDFVHSQLKDGYILKENAKVMVYNGTTLPGVATTNATKLKSYGYNVIGAANTPNTGWTQTTVIDLSGGKYKYTQNYLEQRFNVKAASVMSDTTIATNGADFVIIVGSDEATTPKN